MRLLLLPVSHNKYNGCADEKPKAEPWYLFLATLFIRIICYFLDATGCATDCRAYVAEMSQPQHAFHIGPEDYSFSKLTLRLDMVDQCFHYILCFINGIDSQRASVKANLPGV